MIDNKFIKIYYHHDDNLVFVEFKENCTIQIYEKSIFPIIELFKKNSAEKLILQDLTGDVFMDTTQIWIKDFIRELIHTSCEKIELVIKKDYPHKDEVEVFQALFDDFFPIKISKI